MVGAEATGNQPPIIDGGLKYNAITDALTASRFAGDLYLEDGSGYVLVVGSGVGPDFSFLYNIIFMILLEEVIITQQCNMGPKFTLLVMPMVLLVLLILRSQMSLQE